MVFVSQGFLKKRVINRYRRDINRFNYPPRSRRQFVSTIGTAGLCFETPDPPWLRLLHCHLLRDIRF
jgi:hypothetical protein